MLDRGVDRRVVDVVVRDEADLGPLAVREDAALGAARRLISPASSAKRSTKQLTMLVWTRSTSTSDGIDRGEAARQDAAPARDRARARG